MLNRYEQIRRTVAEFPPLRSYLVVPPETRADDLPPNTLLDVDGVMRARYDIADEAMLLIRPDGYLSLRIDEWAPERLRVHLRRWLLPTTGSASRDGRSCPVHPVLPQQIGVA